MLIYSHHRETASHKAPQARQAVNTKYIPQVTRKEGDNMTAVIIYKSLWWIIPGIAWIAAMVITERDM